MKKIVCVLLLLTLCVALFGCHKAKVIAGFAVPETFDTAREHTITFWAKNDSNENQVAVYRQAIADFEALYPNVHVVLKTYTNYGEIYNDVINNIPTNTTPNVCITYPDHIATYMTGGSSTVVPLDSLFTHADYGFGGAQVRFDSPQLEELVPQFLEECKIGQTHYAIPYMRSTEACYINKTYVEALGYTLPEVLTWDFVWEVSEAAMAKDENGKFLVNGQKVMIPFIYKSTDNMMIQMLRQKDAGYSTDSGEILLFNDTTKELLRTIGVHSKTRAFDTFKSVSYPANYLNKGQCIFAIDSTAGATWMGSDAPLIDIPEDKRVKFETVVMPVPQFDPENMQMISQGPSICVFNKEDPQEVLVSWLFAQFMLTDSVQLAYCQTEGYLPVTHKAMQTEQYETYLANRGVDNELHYAIKLDATRLLQEHIDHTFVTAVFNGSANLRDAAGQLIEESKKAVRQGNELTDAYLDELFENVSAQKHLDQIGQQSGQAAVKKELGPLPVESVILLAALALAWLLIGIYGAFQWAKSKKILISH